MLNKTYQKNKQSIMSKTHFTKWLLNNIWHLQIRFSQMSKYFLSENFPLSFLKNTRGKREKERKVTFSETLKNKLFKIEKEVGLFETLMLQKIYKYN